MGDLEIISKERDLYVATVMSESRLPGETAADRDHAYLQRAAAEASTDWAFVPSEAGAIPRFGALSMGTTAGQHAGLGVSRASPHRCIYACGVALGVTGLILFGTVHALLIVPIWATLYRGAPYAIAVGVAVAWAYHEARRGDTARAGVADGARFGALAWLVAVPAMTLGFGMRSIPGWGQVHWTVDVGTVVLAAAGGAALLWLLARTRRAALAGAVAITLVHAYNGGPMPIDRLARAVGMPIGFLVIQVVGGALLGGLYTRYVSRARTITSSGVA